MEGKKKTVSAARAKAPKSAKAPGAKDDQARTVKPRRKVTPKGEQIPAEAEAGTYPFPATAEAPQSPYPFAPAPDKREEAPSPYPFARPSEETAEVVQEAPEELPSKEPVDVLAFAQKAHMYPFPEAALSQPPAAQRVPEKPPSPEPDDEVRITVELEQLKEMIRDLPFLEYLNPRLDRIIDGHKSFRDLVGFYRLVSRGLKEEFQKVVATAQALRNEADELRKGGPPERAADRDEAELLTLRRLLDAKESVLMDYMQQLEQMKQDVQNIRSRSKAEVEQRIERANEDLLRKLLPVLDNFDRAIAAAKSASSIDSIISGVVMIQRQFEDVLAKEGLTSIKAVGEPFDPHYHEALMEIFTTEVAEDTVYEEITRGWTFGKRVVRPTVVKVAKAPR
jgi:molecular chaperone GrpE